MGNQPKTHYLGAGEILCNARNTTFATVEVGLVSCKNCLGLMKKEEKRWPVIVESAK